MDVRFTPRRTLAVVALAAATAAVPALAAGSESKTQTLRFFSKTTSFVYTAADGTVLEQPSEPPAPGDSFETTDIAFRGDHRHHARHAIGSSHLRCTFGATPDELTCDSQVALRGSLLLFHGDASKPLPIVGGAGKYLGATGSVATEDAPGGVDAVLTVRRR
jgi:hypothetical protein